MKNPAQQQKQLEKKIALRKERGQESPKMQARLDSLRGGQTGTNAAPAAGQIDNTQGFNENTGMSNKYMGNIFNQLQNQGQFNPQGLPSLNQDYSQNRQQAENSVMDSFNRNMNPQFDRQNEQFRQQMAEQGIDEGSAKYKNMYGDMMSNQNNARQNASNQAFQLGQAEQAQGFGQALSANNQMFGQQYNQYQMPLNQLNSMIPFYNQQGNMMQNQQNLDWQGNQADLNRQHDFSLGAQQQKYNMQLQASAPRGGGGGGGGSQPIWAQYGFTSPLQYQQHQMNLAMLQNGGGQQQGGMQPNMGNAAVTGFANGAGAAIGSTLLR